MRLLAASIAAHVVIVGLVVYQPLDRVEAAPEYVTITVLAPPPYLHQPVDKPGSPPPPILQLVAPHVMSQLRTSGVMPGEPPLHIQNAMWIDGRQRVFGTLKVCISATGAIDSVTLLRSTRYPGYDNALRETVERWQYRPYTIDGYAHPACGTVTFVYTIK